MRSATVLLLLALTTRAHAAEMPAETAKELRRAADRMGLAALIQHGFVQLTFDTVLDNAAVMQGDSKQTAVESFAFDLAARASGWESRGDRGDGSLRWRRFAYPDPDVLLRIDFTEKWGGTIRSAAHRNERNRTARFLPHVLVREAMQRMASVRRIAPGTLAYATESGDVLDLRFDAQGRLDRVSTLMAIPFVGDRIVSWQYSGWRVVRDVSLPGNVRIRIGENVARTMTLQSVQWSKESAAFFAIPPGFRVIQERKSPDVLPDAVLGGTVQNVVEGVWFAANVTSGTSAMFIEQDDGITVLEAPAGAHYPQTDIPMPNLVRGAHSSAPAEALVDLVRRTVPGKKIVRAVISHPHADHAGGVRALAAAGAEIYVPDGAAPSVRRFLSEPFILEPDRFESLRASSKPVVREVTARETIGTGPRRLELLRVRGNPHAEEMLVMWLPELKLLFQGDLFYPAPLAEFPSANRVPIMQWFVNWLDREGLAPATIYSAHGDGPATSEHLQKLR